MYKVALVEKPVGTLRVLTFLHEFEKATITDFIARGWNRRTIEQSLKKLTSLGLMERAKTSQFPRFTKEYGLTSPGANVARFADMAKRACREFEGLSFREATKSPKGCMQILVYLSRRQWRGTSDLMAETGLSANQIYKCLESLSNMGILIVERGDRRRAMILSCKPAPGTSDLLTAFDGLDGALERASSWQQYGRM